MKLRFLKIFPLVSFLVFSITFPVSISAQTAEDEVRKNQELSLRPTSTMDLSLIHISEPTSPY